VGGKSRKTGGVSRALIDRLLAGKPSKAGKQSPKQPVDQKPQGLGFKPENEKE